MTEPPTFLSQEVTGPKDVVSSSGKRQRPIGNFTSTPLLLGRSSVSTTAGSRAASKAPVVYAGLCRSMLGRVRGIRDS
jgi:hypothetical protein